MNYLPLLKTVHYFIFIHFHSICRLSFINKCFIALDIFSPNCASMKNIAFCLFYSLFVNIHSVVVVGIGKKKRKKGFAWISFFMFFCGRFFFLFFSFFDIFLPIFFLNKKNKTQFLKLWKKVCIIFLFFVILFFFYFFYFFCFSGHNFSPYILSPNMFFVFFYCGSGSFFLMSSL